MRIKTFTEIWGGNYENENPIAVDMDTIEHIEVNENGKTEISFQSGKFITVKESFEQAAMEWAGRDIFPSHPLRECNLDTRTKDTLLRNGIITIEQLESKTEEEVRCLKNMGKKSFAILKDFMDKNGLRFKEEL